MTEEHDMDVFDAIATTRAMRRLDPARDVPPDALARVLAAATKAPTAKNEQQFRFVVVRDAEQRRRLGDIYRRVSRSLPPMQAPDPAAERLKRSVEHLAEHMHEAPVLIVVLGQGPDDMRMAASVYPAVQNLMLAARALGLGTTLTTRHRSAQEETRAVLGAPADANVYAVIPLGYPLGAWREAKRRSLSELAFLDRWGEPFTDGPR
ncbi:MAG TPA: nitroreductase family protein [Candidatus Limnocylindria bacterium]|nr:nitroreductase family protein [Candidatus Limnocylindria bacterium]